MFWIELLRSISKLRSTAKSSDPFARIYWFGPRAIHPAGLEIDDDQEEKLWEFARTFWNHLGLRSVTKPSISKCWTCEPLLFDSSFMQMLATRENLVDAVIRRIPFSKQLCSFISLKESSEVATLLNSYDGDICFTLPCLAEAFGIPLDGGLNKWTFCKMLDMPKLVHHFTQRLYFDAFMQQFDIAEGITAAKLLAEPQLCKRLERCFALGATLDDSRLRRLASSWRHPLKQAVCSQWLPAISAVVDHAASSAFEAGLQRVEMGVPVELLLYPWIYKYLVSRPPKAAVQIIPVFFLAEITREATWVPSSSDGVIQPVSQRIKALRFLFETPLQAMQLAQNPNIFVAYEPLVQQLKRCLAVDNRYGDSDKGITHRLVGLDLIGDELPYPYCPFVSRLFIELCQTYHLGCRIHCGSIFRLDEDLNLFSEKEIASKAEILGAHLSIVSSAVRYLRDASIPVRLGPQLEYLSLFWTLSAKSNEITLESPLRHRVQPFQSMFHDVFFEICIDPCNERGNFRITANLLAQLCQFTDNWALSSSGCGIWSGTCDCENMDHWYPPAYCKLLRLANIPPPPQVLSEKAFNASFVAQREARRALINPRAISVPVTDFVTTAFASPREFAVMLLAIANLHGGAVDFTDEICRRYFLAPMFFHLLGCYLKPKNISSQVHELLRSCNFEDVTGSSANEKLPLHSTYFQKIIAPDSDAASAVHSILCALDMCLNLIWYQQYTNVVGHFNQPTHVEIAARHYHSPALTPANRSLARAGTSGTHSFQNLASVALRSSMDAIAQPERPSSTPPVNTKNDTQQLSLAVQAIFEFLVRYLQSITADLGNEMFLDACRNFASFGRFHFEYPASTSASYSCALPDDQEDLFKFILNKFSHWRFVEKLFPLLPRDTVVTESGLVISFVFSTVIVYKPHDKDLQETPASFTTFEWCDENTASGNWARLTFADRIPRLLYLEGATLATLIAERQEKLRQRYAARIVGIGNKGSVAALIAALLLSISARNSTLQRAQTVALWIYGGHSFGSRFFWQRVQTQTNINLEIGYWRSKLDPTPYRSASLYNEDRCTIRVIEVTPQGPPYISPWMLRPSHHYYTLASHHLPALLVHRPDRPSADLDVAAPQDHEHLLRSAISLYFPHLTCISIQQWLPQEVSQKLYKMLSPHSVVVTLGTLPPIVSLPSSHTLRHR